MRGTSGFGFGLALLCASLAADAADRGSGHFRKGEVRLAVAHVVAVTNEEDDAGDRTFIYLGSVPLDAGRIAGAFHSTSAVEQQLGEGSAGYVRICVNADGGECGLYFSHNKPSASFNSSGYGEFTLEPVQAGRVAGRWVLAEPNDFFGETYDFDLAFDVAVTPPPGKPLPAGGGEAGKAYQAWTAAVAKGDVARLRGLVGSEYESWRLGLDNGSDVKSALKDLRDGTPVAAKILGGRIDGDSAILKVEGRDRDDILRRGRVLMRHAEGGWRYMEADLDSVDE